MTKYYIITSDDISSEFDIRDREIATFLERKRTKGYDITIKTCGEIESMYRRSLTRSQAISQYIQDEVRQDDPNNNPLGYLLLVGDYDQVPAYTLNYNSVESDAYYGKCPHGSRTPALAVGRISANNKTTIKRIIKIINDYDLYTNRHLRTNAHRGEWMKKVVLTGWLPRGTTATDMSSYFDDAGWQCLKEIDLAEYKAILRLENEETVIDQVTALGDGNERRKIWRVKNTDKQTLVNAINDGCLILRYHGHGGYTGWANIGKVNNSGEDDIFEIADVRSLDVSNRIPFVMSIACRTGDIMSHPSLAEAWQIYGKAIGVYASDIDSALIWNEYLSPRILEQLFTNANLSIGYVLIRAVNDLAVDLAGHIDTNTMKYGHLMYRYFGDPDTVIPITSHDQEKVISKNFCYEALLNASRNPMDIMCAIK